MIPSFFPDMPLLLTPAAALHHFRPTVQAGPGRKTLYPLHSGAHSSHYTGADLRQLNAERGVGRPPRKPSKRKI